MNFGVFGADTPGVERDQQSEGDFKERLKRPGWNESHLYHFYVTIPG